MIIVILSFTFLGIRKTFHFHYDLDHILRGRWKLKLKTEKLKGESVTIETVKRQHLSLSELSNMDHRVTLAIILVIVVVLEIFLLTTGKIFWIVNAALLVSFTAIGMIWKEEWKMTLSRYHWTSSGPQVWEERTAPPQDNNLVNNLRPQSTVPGVLLPSTKTMTDNTSIKTTSPINNTSTKTTTDNTSTKTTSPTNNAANTNSSSTPALQQVAVDQDDTGLPSYEQAMFKESSPYFM